MGYVAVIAQLVTTLVALTALRKAYMGREFSLFTLVIHRDTHDRLNLGFLNGGTQPVTVLQLSYIEEPLEGVPG
jgi:hypothetical protein